MDEDWYKPTDAESEAIDRAGMTAAWHALQPLKDDEMEISKRVLVCLKAFKAAREASNAAEKALVKSLPLPKYISHYSELTDMVCSALMSLDDSPEEIHPCSVLGARLSAFLSAVKAIEAMDNIHQALDDDDGIFGLYLAEETADFAESMIYLRENSTPAKTGDAV